MHLPLGVIAIILIALAFDFINGFHDAANSIATVVSTRVLTPRLAVAWAAFFNFAAFVVFPVTTWRRPSARASCEPVGRDAVARAGRARLGGWSGT